MTKPIHQTPYSLTQEDETPTPAVPFYHGGKLFPSESAEQFERSSEEFRSRFLDKVSGHIGPSRTYVDPEDVQDVYRSMRPLTPAERDRMERWGRIQGALIAVMLGALGHSVYGGTPSYGHLIVIVVAALSLWGSGNAISRS